MPSDPKIILDINKHRPWSLPTRPWRLRQRWNDLLFAHWAVPASMIAPHLPNGLEVDTYDGRAWIGVIPFWMDQVLTRSIGNHTFGVPTTHTFPELNLRTYVRSSLSGRPGVFFFSLDCASPLAVLGARTLFHLPYYPARMSRITTRNEVRYESQRQLSPARYEATYAPAGPQLPPSQPGTLPHFLTERYCLFTPSFGRLLVGDIHHHPWPLQPAAADFRLNKIPAVHGITLPDTAPVLHFSREIEVLLWSLRPDTSSDKAP